MEYLDAVIVYIISDAIGETANQVVQAATSQYGKHKIVVRQYPYVTTTEVLQDVLDKAIEEADLLVYTLVIPGLAEYLEEHSRNAHYQTVNLLGPIFDTFADLRGWKPEGKAGLIHTLDDEYFKEVEAIEFAVKYDDGKDPRGLLRADIILIGVSRTSKTPLSMYLANRGYRVANVPLVPEVMLPAELYAVEKGMIIGLIIKPDILTEIRTERLKALGLGDTATYAGISRINRELAHSLRITEELGCPVIDVTHKAVEETAGLIIEMYKKRSK